MQILEIGKDVVGHGRVIVEAKANVTNEQKPYNESVWVLTIIRVGRKTIAAKWVF